MPEDDLPLLTFADAESLERWLEAQGEASPGAWLRFAKQGAPEPTISKPDAIECHWARFNRKGVGMARRIDRNRMQKASLNSYAKPNVDAMEGRLDVNTTLPAARNHPSFPPKQSPEKTPQHTPHQGEAGDRLHGRCSIRG